MIKFGLMTSNFGKFVLISNDFAIFYSTFLFHNVLLDFIQINKIPYLIYLFLSHYFTLRRIDF